MNLLWVVRLQYQFDLFTFQVISRNSLDKTIIAFNMQHMDLDTLYCNFECQSKLIHLLWLEQASPPSVRASRFSSPLHDNLTGNKKTFSNPRASLEKDVSYLFGLEEFISGYLDSSLRYFLWTILFQLTQSEVTQNDTILLLGFLIFSQSLI